MKVLHVVGVLLFACATAQAADPPASPYVDQKRRSIKALSNAEIKELLAGHGMGYGKSAELNGYPGPAHVLELAESLHLTQEQLNETRALHAGMQARARALGARLVEAEASLEALFQAGEVTDDSLSKALEQIGALRAELRGTHLSAHVDQRALLSADQLASYARLRGYHGDERPRSGHHH